MHCAKCASCDLEEFERENLCRALCINISRRHYSVENVVKILHRVNGCLQVDSVSTLIVVCHWMSSLNVATRRDAQVHTLPEEMRLTPP